MQNQIEIPASLQAAMQDPNVSAEMILAAADAAVLGMLQAALPNGPGAGQFALAHQRITESRFWFNAGLHRVAEASKPSLVIAKDGFPPNHG